MGNHNCAKQIMATKWLPYVKIVMSNLVCSNCIVSTNLGILICCWILEWMTFHSLGKPPTSIATYNTSLKYS